ncbi:10068_t:CDS:1, partial [Scutellospora calospora]
SRSNFWPKSWKRFYIELSYFRGYTMLYPNYINATSFSTNYAENGVHFHYKGKAKNQWLVPLMKEDIILEGLPGGHLPNFEDLPTMDLWGKVISQKNLIQRGRNYHKKISKCPPNNELTYDPRDILCKNDYSRSFNNKNTKKLKEEKDKITPSIENNITSIDDNKINIDDKEDNNEFHDDKEN